MQLILRKRSDDSNQENSNDITLLHDAQNFPSITSSDPQNRLCLAFTSRLWPFCCLGNWISQKVKFWPISKTKADFFFFFNLWHMEGSFWARGWSKAAAEAYTTLQLWQHLDPSHICDLYSLWQYRILNPMSKARDWISILMDTMSGSEPAEPQQELLKFFSCVFLRSAVSNNLPKLSSLNLKKKIIYLQYPNFYNTQK